MTRPHYHSTCRSVEPLAFGDLHHRPPLPAQRAAHLTAQALLPLLFLAKGVALSEMMAKPH